MYLLDKVPELLETGGNMAYICKFDRKRGVGGKEHLYTGGDSFSSAETIDEKVSGILDSAFKEGPDIPVIFPYDFITQVFPESGIRRSGWPLIAGFVPEKAENSLFMRTEATVEHPRIPGETDQEFSALVGALRKRIISGEILQGVLSRRFELPFMDPVVRLRRFMLSDRSLYVFLFRIGGLTVLGSSPENLITVSDGKAEIFPIAGTVPRGETPEDDERLGRTLENSEKDKLEHRMLVDLARNDLGKISIDGSVEVSESMVLRKYASVQHLVSRVVSRVPDYTTPLSIVRAVFPAGTVSGAPKRRAVELIDSMEPYPRGGYAGAAGVIGRKTIDLALLIRSVFGSGNTCYTQAGAGIVKDSVPEMESREVMSKVMTVMGGMKDECVDC